MTELPRPLRIFGAGVRAQVVVDQIAWHFADRLCIEGYYDDAKSADSAGPGGFPVLGSTQQGVDELPQSGADAFLALGTYRSWRSFEILIELRRREVHFPRLIAPTAHVSPSAEIGENALVMAGVFIGAYAKIGDLFTAHGCAVVEHHGRIGHNVLLGPGATLCGFAQIGSHVFLGAGTQTIPSVSIGSGTMTGAGAVVVGNLPPGVLAVGCPARKQRAIGANDEVPEPSIVARLATLEQETRPGLRT